ncbi:MAG TPA: hypothetical protein VFQ61_01800 [Polyangiaceae bacterium]|nr:hypothetical protein [Polyangiaceae bacterium]
MTLEAFPVGIVHGVSNLEAALAFFEDVLGFPVRERGPEHAICDNGSVRVKLELDLEATQPLCFELVTRDLERCTQELLDNSEVRLVKPAYWATSDRRQVVLAVGDYLRLAVCRTYDEDELGLDPALPATLEWNRETDTLIRTLLRSVPSPFRVTARKRATERAEYLTTCRGESEVHTSAAVQALIDVTPGFQHEALAEALLASGIDPTPFFGSLH